MILASIEGICSQHSEWSEQWAQFKQAKSLPAMVGAVLQIGLLLARMLLEEELNQRAQAVQVWPLCAQCGRRYRSKGFRARQMTTLIGVVR